MRWPSVGRRRRRGERGVTLVEYALVAAVILVTSVGAIASLQDSVGEDIEEHGASAGAPDLPDAGIPATTSPTVPPTVPATTATTAAPGVTATATFSNPQVGLNNGGSQWSPSISVRAVDSATNTTMTNVTITVTWTYTESNGAVRTITSEPCSAPSTGVCSFQLTNSQRLAANGNNCVGSVQVAVTTISSSSQTVTYASGSATTTITRGTC